MRKKDHCTRHLAKIITFGDEYSAIWRKKISPRSLFPFWTAHPSHRLPDQMLETYSRPGWRLINAARAPVLLDCRAAARLTRHFEKKVFIYAAISAAAGGYVGSLDGEKFRDKSLRCEWESWVFFSRALRCTHIHVRRFFASTLSACFINLDFV